jgi:hypothetical protein
MWAISVTVQAMQDAPQQLIQDNLASQVQPASALDDVHHARRLR